MKGLRGLPGLSGQLKNVTDTLKNQNNRRAVSFSGGGYTKKKDRGAVRAAKDGRAQMPPKGKRP